MSAKKKVLIITYYWPPSGGSGVQRWLKFTKYLPTFNWEPIIYTPSNPEIPIADTGLYNDIPKEAKIITRPIWEPYSFYKRFLGMKKTDRIQTGFLSEKKKKPWLEAVSVWIRGNFFIPDARKFWIKPSIRYLKYFLKENPVDVIISTGPPHSMHLIASGLKPFFPQIPWIADFRDPWTNIDFYNELKLSSWADKKHHLLEKTVLDRANQLIVVGKTMKEEFEKITDTPVSVITNGFDESDFETLPTPKDQRFSLVHVGSLPPNRNPKQLFRALNDLVKESPELKHDLCIRLIGNTDYSVLESIEKNGLTTYLDKIDYLPHNEVITEQKRAAVLLLVLNKSFAAKGILTGKVFEYLAAQRPILGIGDEDSDVAEVLRDSGAGEIVDHEDTESIKRLILNLYDDWKSGKDRLDKNNIHKYSRFKLTEDLDSILRNHS